MNIARRTGADEYGIVTFGNNFLQAVDPGTEASLDAHLHAELLAHAPDGVGPGKTVWLGLQLQHQPHWHTYWKNPGDSGLPTLLQWTLPPGLSAGEIAWPAPKRLPIGTRLLGSLLA